MGKGRQKANIGLNTDCVPSMGMLLGKLGGQSSTACCLQSHRWQLSLLWPSGLKLWKLGKRSRHEAFFFASSPSEVVPLA